MEIVKAGCILWWQTPQRIPKEVFLENLRQLWWKFSMLVVFFGWNSREVSVEYLKHLQIFLETILLRISKRCRSRENLEEAPRGDSSGISARIFREGIL